MKTWDEKRRGQGEKKHCHRWSGLRLRYSSLHRMICSDAHKCAMLTKSELNTKWCSKSRAVFIFQFKVAPGWLFQLSNNVRQTHIGQVFPHKYMYSNTDHWLFSPPSGPITYSRCHLHKEKAHLNWNYASFLTLRYTYSLKPKGVPLRFFLNWCWMILLLNRIIKVGPTGFKTCVFHFIGTGNVYYSLYQTRLFFKMLMYFPIIDPQRRKAKQWVVIHYSPLQRWVVIYFSPLGE